MATNRIGDVNARCLHTEEMITMSNKDTQPYHLPKEEVDAVKKAWEQRMKANPALAKSAKEFFSIVDRPPTELEQKLADEMKAELKAELKKLNKGS